jgi:hypothetical protein
MAGEVEKINVRSPYYLTVDSSDAPPDYTPPATLTQTLECGGEVNIGEDVGTRIYEIDMADRSGTFTINYTIYTPVKITTQVTGESVVNRGYIGGDTNKQQLIDIGVASSDLTGLTSGDFAQGGIAISKSTDAQATLTITVDAPLKTDNYKISMACPAKTVVTQPTVPSPPSVNDNCLVSGSEALYMKFPKTLGCGTIRSSDGNEQMDIFINGTKTDTLSVSELGWSSTTDDVYVIFSEQTGHRWAGTNILPAITSDATIIEGSLLSRPPFNTIGFRFISPNATGAFPEVIGPVDIGITSLFKNASTGNLEWADPHKYATFNNYCYTTAPMFTNENPVQLRQTFCGRFWFSSNAASNPTTIGRVYGFHYSPAYMAFLQYAERRSIIQELSITSHLLNNTIDGLKIYGFNMSGNDSRY